MVRSVGDRLAAATSPTAAEHVPEHVVGCPVQQLVLGRDVPVDAGGSAAQPAPPGAKRQRLLPPFAHGLIVNHPEIGDIAASYDVSAPQLCIRYLLQRGAVVLPKATTTAHIAQNAELDFVISDADLAVLDAMRDTDKHDDAMEFRWS